MLIGAAPPAAISDWRYLAASVCAGMITFWWAPPIERLQNPVRMFDAVGLALFTVAGAQNALAFGLNPVMAALLGMLTGIGGGMVRDLQLADVPMVLRADLYAVATLAGAGGVIGAMLGLPSAATMIAGAVCCFGLPMLAVRRGRQLPIAGGHRAEKPDDATPKS